MSGLSIVRRPIRLETRAPAQIIGENLNRIAAIRGRASEWGIQNNAELAELWAAESIEADFTRSYFRAGFVEASAASFLPGYAFSRTGAGTARDTLGRVQTFASGVPRITDFGLLVESMSVNLLLQSNDLSASPWFGSNAFATGAYSTAPDGTASAARIEASGESAFWLQVLEISEPDEVFSVFVKKGSGAEEGNHFIIRDYGAGTNPVECTVNYDTGAVTYSVGTGPAQMEKYADGWWRLDISATGMTPGPEMGVFVGFAFTNGATGQWMLAWGGQVERRRTPTSLIPTTSAVATRGGDLFALANTTSPVAGTVMAEFRRGRPTGTEEAIAGNSSGEALLLMTGAQASSYVRADLLVAGVAPSAFEISRAAITWSSGLRRVAFSGGASVSDDCGGPSDPQLQIGSQTGAWRLNGYVRRLLHASLTAPAAQLEAMV